MKTRKYYFLPFLDNIFAVLISLLFTVFFGSWASNKIFGTVMGIALTLVMCGFFYSRMWKVGRKNIRYHYGLPKNFAVKHVFPYVIACFVVILIYVLAKHNILPLKDAVIKTYYTFPDNLPREQVIISLFDYLQIFVRFWFSYLLPFTRELPVWMMCIAPVLSVIFSVLGYTLGTQNKEIIDAYAKTVNKAKEKFNE